DGDLLPVLAGHGDRQLLVGVGGDRFGGGHLGGGRGTGEAVRVHGRGRGGGLGLSLGPALLGPVGGALRIVRVVGPVRLPGAAGEGGQEQDEREQCATGQRSADRRSTRAMPSSSSTPATTSTGAMGSAPVAARVVPAAAEQSTGPPIGSSASRVSSVVQAS